MHCQHYGSEAWTGYASQERKLHTLHMRSQRRIHGITWRDKVTINYVLNKESISSKYTFLCKRRLRWLGRIPKDFLYSELAEGK